MTHSSTSRGLMRAVWPLPILLLLVVVATEVAYRLGSGVTQSVVVVALINLTIVVGLFIFVGSSGVLSFGHIGFAAIGAYTAGLLVIPTDQKSVLQPDLPAFLMDAHFSAVTATLVGGLAAAAFALLMAVPLMRLNGLAAGLATFAMLVIIRTVANSWQQVTNGAAGLSGIPVTTSEYDALAFAVVAIVIGFVFQASAVGLRLRASREDDVAARSLGIGIRFERRIAWVLSAFVTGIGGALYGQYLGSFNADAFYLALTFTTLAMLVVGGMTSLSGAVIGSLAISFVAEVLHRFEQGADLGPLHIPSRPGLREVGLAAIMILILILRPRGITGGRELPARLPSFPRRTSRRDDDSPVAGEQSS